MQQHFPCHREERARCLARGARQPAQVESTTGLGRVLRLSGSCLCSPGRSVCVVRGEGGVAIDYPLKDMTTLAFIFTLSPELCIFTVVTSTPVCGFQIVQVLAGPCTTLVNNRSLQQGEPHSTSHVRKFSETRVPFADMALSSGGDENNP